jgi:nucleoid-associated protein YgaU
MQPIERYALVSLLFLIVLIVVGALWDDGKVDASAGPSEEIARSQATESRPSPWTRSSRRREGLPLNTLEPAPGVARQRTAAPQAPVERRTAVPAESAARQQSGTQTAPTYRGLGDSRAARDGVPSVEDLKGTLRPEPREGWSDRYLNSRELPSATGGVATAAPGPARSGSARSGSARSGSVRSGSVRSASAVAPRAAAEVLTRPRVEPAKIDGPRTRAYTIRSGDSLERIARRELKDPKAVDRIASLNGLSKPFTIYPGQKLLLPTDPVGAATTLSAPTSTATAVPAQAPAATGGRPTYTVRPGDSLSVVLDRELGTYKRSLPLVKTLNPGLDVNQIHPGMRIVLPRTDEIPGVPTVAAAAPAAEPVVRTPRPEFIVR